MLHTDIGQLGEMTEGTYIRVSPELFDNRVIEMARVAKEVATNLVGVSKTPEDIVYTWELATLPELDPLLLTTGVDFLDPRVVVRSGRVCHMLLELDDV